MDLVLELVLVLVLVAENAWTPVTALVSVTIAGIIRFVNFILILILILLIWFVFVFVKLLFVR
jgi:hypothetical protein